MSMPICRKFLTINRTANSTTFAVDSQKESLGEFVKRIRREKKLSTTDVEKKSGGAISSSYVTRLENEPFRTPSLVKLKALAKGLGITDDEIIAAAGERSMVTESSQLEIAVLKFNGLPPPKRDKVTPLIDILNREMDRLMNEE